MGGWGLSCYGDEGGLKLGVRQMGGFEITVVFKI